MLVVDRVHFARGDVSVLQGLDLSVEASELVGVVGPNGAGKTTLMRLISGVLRPHSGRILVDGTDLAGLSTGRRARLVSVVPQNPQLPLSFSVVDLVLMGRNPHLKLFQWEGRHDLEVAWRSMELTETAHLAERAIETLSGGERQRAVVATALAQDAPILLLDEPTSNLDLSHQSRVMDLVKKVQRERGGAVLVAMHDLTLAAQYCDRLVMLADGRSYIEGPPETVLTRENIARAYGVDATVLSHPATGKPVVVSSPDGFGPGPELTSETGLSSKERR